MLPEVSGKDVAINWYKTKRSYNFGKNSNVLHAHAGKESFTRVRHLMHVAAADSYILAEIVTFIIFNTTTVCPSPICQMHVM